jgi:hypothetical protein
MGGEAGVLGKTARLPAYMENRTMEHSTGQAALKTEMRLVTARLRMEMVFRSANRVAHWENARGSAAETRILATPPTICSLRLAALRPRIEEAVKTDPQFAWDFVQDPIPAAQKRFGMDAMPNEGEYVQRSADGGASVVFPVSNVVIPVVIATDELPDELLEAASGGAPTNCVQPSNNEYS